MHDGNLAADGTGEAGNKRIAYSELSAVIYKHQCYAVTQGQAAVGQRNLLAAVENDGTIVIDSDIAADGVFTVSGSTLIAQGLQRGGTQ